MLHIENFSTDYGSLPSQRYPAANEIRRSGKQRQTRHGEKLLNLVKGFVRSVRIGYAE